MLVHVNATEQFKNNKKGVAMLEELCKKAYRMDSVMRMWRFINDKFN